MTDAEIDNLGAGVTLEILVAEQVMGLENVCNCTGLSDYTNDECNACGGAYRGEYSTDMEAAWEVVERLRPLQVRIENAHGRKQVWGCVFYDRDGGSDGFWPELKTVHQEVSVAESAPIAICRAALKAVRK